MYRTLRGQWYGKPLTARAQAPSPRPWCQADSTASGDRRGYFRADFVDAWDRYVPPSEPVTTVTTVPDGDGTDPELANDDDVSPPGWKVEAS
jgi:hypothetical protein